MTPYVRTSRRQQIFNFDPRLVYNGESFDPNTAVAALEQFLALFNPPTAVLAANNFIAIGFIRAVRKHGMDIPTHFALTCFEKIEPIDLVKPVPRSSRAARFLQAGPGFLLAG